MKKEYDHKKLEKKWQTFWDKKGTYEASNISKKKKFYSLIEFPYPSGDGLHVGHPRPYIGMDIISRKKRMEGFNVLYPIGWDAFGLPTENYAIKTGQDPRVVTKKNSDTFRRQIKSLGVSFDWSREINTTDPKYYKWTQWIFLQLLKKGLAYKAKMAINWCPKDKTGLANEEVINGCCERCGTPVEKKEKEQWMLAITKYADRLDKDLDEVDYLPQIKLSQRNWIGKSEGINIDYKLVDSNKIITCFTTTPVNFGASFIVIAPEHPTVLEITKKENIEKVKKYIKEVSEKADVERFGEKEKTGVFTGSYVLNHVTNEKIPVWVSDFVLMNFGTGAVQGCPAHDERDFEFARKYGLPIKQVIMPEITDLKNPPRFGKKDTVRHTVHIMLRNPKTKEFLFQFLKGEKWKGIDPKSFLIGGVEEGESEEEAAAREIKEETGYLNFKFVEKVPFQVQSKFFAAHKDVNRTITVNTLLFDLISDEKTEITEDEYFTKDSHEMKWIPEDKVSKTLSTEDQQMIWKYYQSGGFAYHGDGIMINSDFLNGMKFNEAMEKTKDYFEKKGWGKRIVTFKLRDWVFSRQRYWGEPIPVINCAKCGLVPVAEKNLPVLLPKVKNYQPTDSGESPLANISKWVNTKCPKCKGKAKRETDTMPNWAGSSWYYLRYTDTKNKKEFASKKNLKYWLGSDPHHGGVNWYNGGNEHTTLHLLYSRFWHKFLFDLKLVPTNEPYMKRTSHGIILAQGGEKMSKSKGNVVNPDKIVDIYGADTLRLYEMFMGPFDQAIAWSEDALVGPRRFLERVWNLQYKVERNKKYNEFEIEKAIKKVSADIEEMKFNTAVSTLMIFMNEIIKLDSISRVAYEKFLIILTPFAPHITEELWSALGNKKSIHIESWPKWNPSLIKDSEVKIVIQVNGKLRAEIFIGADESEEGVKQKALQNTDVIKYTEGKVVRKVIYVKNRLINIVL